MRTLNVVLIRYLPPSILSKLLEADDKARARIKIDIKKNCSRIAAVVPTKTFKYQSIKKFTTITVEKLKNELKKKKNPLD